jgi:hypothetical protein
MQESELKSVQITVAGRTFPLKVTSKESAMVSLIEEDINRRITDFQDQYKSRDKMDCVLMTLIDGAFQQPVTNSAAAYSAPHHSDSVLKEINALLDVMES